MPDNISQNGGLQIFNYEDHEVRTVLIDGETWWVAIDVCAALDLDVKQIKKHLSKLDDDEKGRTKITTLGGMQETSIINEPGLYGLVFNSRKPGAKDFKRWVKHEVLPAIRKTGSYTSPTQPALPTGLINSLWISRTRLFSKYTKIPVDKFCVFEEISMPFFNIELRGYELPGKAVPDSSVGGRWCTYLRDVLKFDDSLIENYPHHYPDHRGTINAYIYPIDWLPAFRTWFRAVYIPVHLPDYLKRLKASREEIQEILKGFGVNPQIEGK
jgi:hypothetical protein